MPPNHRQRIRTKQRELPWAIGGERNSLSALPVLNWVAQRVLTQRPLRLEYDSF